MNHYENAVISAVKYILEENDAAVNNTLQLLKNKGVSEVVVYKWLVLYGKFFDE